MFFRQFNHVDKMLKGIYVNGTFYNVLITKSCKTLLISFLFQYMVLFTHSFVQESMGVWSLAELLENWYGHVNLVRLLWKYCQRFLLCAAVSLASKVNCQCRKKWQSLFGTMLKKLSQFIKKCYCILSYMCYSVHT